MANTKQIDFSALKAGALWTVYVDDIVAIGEAIQARKAIAVDTDARDKADNTVATSVKAFVTKLTNDGHDADTIAATLREGLATAGMPKGTVDNYSAIAKGFRLILDTDGPGTLEKATTRQAQALTRSPEKVRLDDAREEFRKYLSAANAEQVAALTAHARDVLGIKPRERKTRSDSGNNGQQTDSQDERQQQEQQQMARAA